MIPSGISPRILISKPSLETSPTKSVPGCMGGTRLSSFDVMDRIVDRLANREIFPNLKTIVIAGHSAHDDVRNQTRHSYL